MFTEIEPSVAVVHVSVRQNNLVTAAQKSLGEDNKVTAADQRSVRVNRLCSTAANGSMGHNCSGSHLLFGDW